MKGSFVRGMLLAGCVVFSAGAAQAGFQWTAPMGGMTSGPAVSSMARPSELPPRAAAAPIAPVMSESLPGSMSAINAGAPIATMPDGPISAAPIYGQGPNGMMTNDPISWNPVHAGPQNAAIAAPRGPQNIMPAEAVPLTPVTAQPVMPATMMAAPQAPVAAAYSQYTVAEGFGRDLPLAMAIRQIVPAQFGFVFGQGIDVASHVSWQGGRPWDLVLQDTLAPMGMTASINGNVVSITRTGAAPVMQTAALTTETVQTTTTTTMAPTPISMTSGPVVQDMGMGNSGYVNASTQSKADLMSPNNWSAPRNSTLRNILEGWCERAGVELYWASEYDYPIQSAVSLQGTFENAVQTLLKGLSDSKPRPLGRLHPNLPDGPAVLVIETRQNSM